MRNLVVVISVLILILLISGLYFLNQNQQASSQTPNSPSPTLLAPKPSPQKTPIPVPEDWETFNSETYGISLRHPKDFTVEETQEGVRIVKLGQTQSLGTELYDGISVLIRTGTLDNQTLEEFVDTNIQETKDQPINATVSSKEKVRLLELDGFTYHVSSLGEATYTLLPIGTGRYLEIINSTVDPSDMGYQKTVDIIISSLEF